MDVILKYFHDLTDTQIEQYRQLYDLYADWNAKINVISRKDIENLYTNHVLHSLAIAKFTDFKPESAVLDVGTGGGFPGIPLAIMFPETHFLLIDRTGKKVKVAQAVAQSIGLQNVECRQCDVAEVKERFDFVVSRAVMELPALVALVRKNIKTKCINSIPNGLICLKGGDLTAELQRVKAETIVDNLNRYFEEKFFDTKKVIYVVL